MQNNVFLKDAPGQLVKSVTEPLLSVAEDKNLTEGLVGTEMALLRLLQRMHKVKQVTVRQMESLQRSIHCRGTRHCRRL